MAAAWKIKGLYKGDPEIVAAELAALGDNFSPDDIVELARSNPESELHKCFEWDDRRAAENYRRSQARCICTNLVTVQATPKGGTAAIRLFYKTTEEEGYKPTALVIRHMDEYATLLLRAKSELAAYRRKYSSITELAEIFELADDFIRSDTYT